MIAGYVLAGGRSSRMGRPKALLRWRGSALAAHVARALEAGGCARVRLVGDLPGLESLGWPVVPDAPAPDRHPLRGVVAALADAAPGPVLVATCDVPLLAEDDVRALLAVGGPCEAVVDGARQPLLGVVGPHHAARLAAAIEAGASVRRTLAGRPAVPLPHRAGVNVNTPADLAMLDAVPGDER